MDLFHFILFMFESSWGLGQSYNFFALNFTLVSDITFTILVLPLGMLFTLSFHSWFLLLTQNPSQNFYMSSHCKLTVSPKTSLSKATIFIGLSLWELELLEAILHTIVDAVLFFVYLLSHYYGRWVLYKTEVLSWLPLCSYHIEECLFH